MKKQGFQPTSSKLGGLKSQILSRGWPDHIKNEEAREQHFKEQMQGRLFEEVRFKTPPSEVVDWNTLQKLKRT